MARFSFVFFFFKKKKSTFYSSEQEERLSVISLESNDGKDSHTITNILFWLHSAIIFLSPSFCSPFTFLSPSSCPHYLSLVYSITAPPHPPQVLLLSCLLILIFIYRFSSFSLPFLCTDGTLQLASHSTSCLTSLQINAFHILSAFFWYNDHNTRRLCKTREAWLWQRTHTENEEVLTAFYYSRTTKVSFHAYTLEKRGWYGSRKTSE